MSELVLGTAQLGLDYGVNNSVGKPSKAVAFELLDTAYMNGIRILDTAAAYGDSEKIIGDYIRMTKRILRVCTKLPKTDGLSIRMEEVKGTLENSIKNLGVNCIDYFLLHDFNDMLNDRILYYLCEMKKSGDIQNIGVSLYEPEQLMMINSQFNNVIDAVQIPFNILDHRWLGNNMLKDTKSYGIKLFARSVFLQGLIFADREKADRVNSNAFNYIKKLRKVSEELELSVEQLALEYIKRYEEIDFVIIGCEETGQIQRNAESFNSNTKMLNHRDLSLINEYFVDVEKEIIDPRCWPK